MLGGSTHLHSVVPHDGRAPELRDPFVEPGGRVRHVHVRQQVGVLVQNAAIPLARVCIHSQHDVVLMRAGPVRSNGALTSSFPELRQHLAEVSFVADREHDDRLSQIEPGIGEHPREHRPDALEVQGDASSLFFTCARHDHEVRAPCLQPRICLRCGQRRY